MTETGHSRDCEPMANSTGGCSWKRFFGTMELLEVMYQFQSDTWYGTHSIGETPCMWTARQMIASTVSWNDAVMAT